MKTVEELKAMYIALGEKEKVAERHARSAYQMQNPEGLMAAYARGSQIKARQEAKHYNNLH